MPVPWHYTNHPGLEHWSIDGLGRDWEWIGDRTLPSRPPAKLYLPHTVEDVVAAMRECRLLGQRPTIRGSGHSSNDLVVRPGGVILSSARLNQVIAIDTARLEATIGAGAITADLDAQLAQQGLGLPVIGDHNDISAGGFASVGGFGPASHRVGAFIDNVLGLEYVDYDGVHHRLRGDADRAAMWRVLGATGQAGMIVALTVRLIGVDKWRTILRNRRFLFWRLESFLAASAREMVDETNHMQRGFWFDTPLAGRHLAFGRFYAYRMTRGGWWRRAWDRLAFGWLWGVGAIAGHLPRTIDLLLKGIGFLGMVDSPRYGAIKHVECFTDRLMDATVGDPTRWFICLVPHERYAELARALYALARRYRDEHGCFTLVALYVKGLRSAWLGGGEPRAFVELTLYVGIAKTGLAPDRLRAFVDAIDDACLRVGSFRYMHSRTGTDPARRAQLDPHARYAVPAAAETPAMAAS